MPIGFPSLDNLGSQLQKISKNQRSYVRAKYDIVLTAAKKHRPALVQHRFRQFWANIPFLYQNQADVTPRTNHVPIILNVYEYFVFFTFFYRSRIIPSGKETRVAILAPI